MLCMTVLVRILAISIGNRFGLNEASSLLKGEQRRICGGRLRKEA